MAEEVPGEADEKLTPRQLAEAHRCCQNCRFFEDAYTDFRGDRLVRVGECHGAPPSADEEWGRRWPVVDYDEWCGAFQSQR